MEKESTSFWADIKKYEDILAKDPSSYCFAPLSELYRKLGLLDDAVAVAKQGIEAHPLYIGGFMALGRALFEKGSRDDAKAALEKVVQATPENLLAQRILSQIYQDEGNLTAAERALQLLVTFNPEDTESSLALEVLQRSMHLSEETEPVSTSSPDFGDKRREAYSQASDLTDEEPLPVPVPAAERLGSADLDEADDPSWSDADAFTFDESPETETAILPLPTVTLAELYEGQGFLEKALEVYRELVKNDPESQLLQERVSALSSRLGGESNCLLSETTGETTVQVEEGQLNDSAAVLSGNDPGCLCPNGQGADELTLINILGQWLDAVRRRKECR